MELKSVDVECTEKIKIKANGKRMEPRDCLLLNNIMLDNCKYLIVMVIYVESLSISKYLLLSTNKKYFKAYFVRKTDWNS